MKKAINAYTIGDKLFNLERIHSKIVTYTCKHFQFNQGLDLKELKTFLENLNILVECMSENLNSKNVFDYSSAISQTLRIVNESEKITNINLFNSCCYLHGCFTRFNKTLKNEIKRGCEINYQNVCNPLMLLELEIKNKKKHNSRSN
ncbi:hypothetical protein [Dokdonia sp.]|uniref:hypothetical protein n=1 Tax=Dokdonia sp. TaxID=2024995 RepID=UPI0032640F2E